MGLKSVFKAITRPVKKVFKAFTKIVMKAISWLIPTPDIPDFGVGEFVNRTNLFQNNSCITYTT